jgi:surfactin synthase thioesterase subunit
MHSSPFIWYRVGIELCGVNLPGRRPNEIVNGFDAKQPFDYLCYCCDTILSPLIRNHLKSKPAGCPILFFGHSLGALVAFEVARSMELSNDVAVSLTLVVSSALSPYELTAKNLNPSTEFHYTKSDTQLFEHIVDIGEF